MKTRRSLKQKHRSHIKGEQAWIKFAVRTGVLDRMQGRIEKMDKQIKARNRKKKNLKYTLTTRQLTVLICDAIREITNQECPFCQAYIGANKFLDENDVKQWLLRRNLPHTEIRR